MHTFNFPRENGIGGSPYDFLGSSDASVLKLDTSQKVFRDDFLKGTIARFQCIQSCYLSSGLSVTVSEVSSKVL